MPSTLFDLIERGTTSGKFLAKQRAAAYTKLKNIRVASMVKKANLKGILQGHWIEIAKNMDKLASARILYKIKKRLPRMGKTVKREGIATVKGVSGQIGTENKKPKIPGAVVPPIA